MKRTEELRNELLEQGCEVETSFISPSVVGLYVAEEAAPYIIVKPGLTAPEELATLAHEAGHHYTGLTGHHSKDEARAERWAVNYLLSPRDLLNAILRGAQSIYDLADMLQLPEDFLLNAIALTAQQYGQQIDVDNYRIYLSPIRVECLETGQVWPEE